MKALLKKRMPLLMIMSSFIRWKHLVPSSWRHIITLSTSTGLIDVLLISIMTTQHSCSHLSANTIFITSSYIMTQQTWEEQKHSATCDCQSIVHMIHHSVFAMWWNDPKTFTMSLLLGVNALRVLGLCCLNFPLVFQSFVVTSTLPSEK